LFKSASQHVVDFKMALIVRDSCEIVVVEPCVKQRRLRKKTSADGLCIGGTSSSGPRNVVTPDARGHYDILGLPRRATVAEIRSSYRRLALVTHPDKGGRAEDFLKVSNSWEILANAATRKEYDDQCIASGSQDGLGLPSPSCSSIDSADSENVGDSGLARELLVRLLDMESSAWQEVLNKCSSLLDYLEEHISQQEKLVRPSRQRENLRQQDFPREVPTPETMREVLPDGWKCFEYMYKSGKCEGNTYIRYHNSWKPTQQWSSMRSVIKKDAAIKGIDPAQKLQEYEKLKEGRNNKKQSSDASLKNQRIQTCIYSTASGRYYVTMNWDSFRVSTKSTDSLQVAVDWHIALSQAKHAAKARVLSLRRSGEEHPDPFTKEEYVAVLRQAPQIQMVFGCNFSGAGLSNIYTNSTTNLEMAMKMHAEFRAVIRNGQRRGDLMKETFENMRQDFAAEIQKMNGLLHKELLSLRCEVKAIRTSISLGELEPPKDRCQMVSFLLQLRPPETCGSSQVHSNSPLISLALPRHLDKKRKRSDARYFYHASKDLQDALHLDDEEALALTKVLRKLPVDVIARRVQQLRAPLRGRRSQHVVSPIATPSMVSPGASSHAALPSPEDVESPRAHSRKSLLTLSLENDPASSLALSPLKVRRPQDELDLCRRGASKRSSNDSCAQEFISSESHFIGIAKACSTLVEVCRFGAVSVSASHAATVEMHTRLKHFVYSRSTLGFMPRKSRRGRELRTLDGESARRVVQFLTHSKHLSMFQDMDLSCVPIDALESDKLQASFKSMSQLKCVTLPNGGWSSPNARLRFLLALPANVSHRRI